MVAMVFCDDAQCQETQRLAWGQHSIIEFRGDLMTLNSNIKTFKIPQTQHEAEAVDYMHTVYATDA